jgi:hypothetical protein
MEKSNAPPSPSPRTDVAGETNLRSKQPKLGLAKAAASPSPQPADDRRMGLRKKPPKVESPTKAAKVESPTKAATSVPPTPPPDEDPHTAFANDPIRSSPLYLSKKAIGDLNGPNFLTTNLLDYIIQHGMPRDLPKDVIIGSSNSFSFF